MGAFNIATGLSADPAEEQAKAAAASQAWQERMYNTTRADMAPYLAQGKKYLGTMDTAMSPGSTLDPNARYKEFTFSQDDPSYKWRVQQGTDALTAAGAAMGNLGSGNLGTALINYGQQAGSQEYQNAFNRYQAGLNDWMSQRAASYNMLAGASNPNAPAQMGNFAMQAGVNMGNTAQQGAMNTMAAQQMQANNLQGAMGSLSQLGQGIYSMYNQNQLRNQTAGWNQFQGQAANNFGYTPVDYGGGGVTQGADMYAGDLWA